MCKRQWTRSCDKVTCTSVSISPFEALSSSLFLYHSRFPSPAQCCSKQSVACCHAKGTHRRMRALKPSTCLCFPHLPHLSEMIALHLLQSSLQSCLLPEVQPSSCSEHMSVPPARYLGLPNSNAEVDDSARPIYSTPFLAASRLHANSDICPRVCKCPRARTVPKP